MPQICPLYDLNTFASRSCTRQRSSCPKLESCLECRPATHTKQGRKPPVRLRQEVSTAQPLEAEQRIEAALRCEWFLHRDDDIKGFFNPGSSVHMHDFDALRALQSVESSVCTTSKMPGAADVGTLQPDGMRILSLSPPPVPKPSQIIAVLNMAHMLQREAFCLRKVIAQVCSGL
jgi:hypothetical protein